MSEEASKEPDFFVNAKDELKQYLQDRLLLVKMQATEKGSRLISTLVVGMLGALLFFFILLFLSLVAGFVFSSLFNNFYIGFGIIAGFYLLLGTVFVLMRKRITQFLIDMIIRIVFDRNEEEN